MAKCLEVLLSQINTLSPNRDKSSDGGIGDEHHATRDSDHNPWVKDGDMGVVTARDFTNDPVHGIDSEELAEALRAAQDDRIKYIISNRKIASGTGQDHAAWQWRPYNGSNPHNHHVHVSVKAEKEFYDSTRDWVIALNPSPAAVVVAPILKDPVLRRGGHGRDVERLQNLLNASGAALDVDGDFGGATKDAVEQFQTANGLVADGVVGRYTWEVLENIG